MNTCPFLPTVRKTHINRFFSFFFVSFSCLVYAKMTLTIVMAVLAWSWCVVVHYFNVPLFMSYNNHEAIRGTVYILKLEKDDLIAGEFHLDCSLADGWKPGHECLLVKFLFVVSSIIKDMISQKYMSAECNVSFAGMTISPYFFEGYLHG